ncbi:MAG: hypothetical protein IJW46_00600 [Clostridia bacterium]|nr:hypothetical protein [Clostridia bacterium]
MSGPKSSRYRLTPEQRKALEEARRREIARRQGLVALTHHRNTLDCCQRELTDCRESVRILKRRGMDTDALSDRLDTLFDTIASLKTTLFLPDNATLEEVEAALKAEERVTALAKEREEVVYLAADAEAKLKEALSDSLSEGMTVSFADLDETKALAEKRMALRRVLMEVESNPKVPSSLKREVRQALILVTEAEDLRTLEAVTVIPLTQKAREAEAEYDVYKAEHTALYHEYCALCELCAIPPITFECTKEGTEILARTVKTLRYEIAYDDEESYIGDVLNRVMREMGYHVLAERTVNKKSGKRFCHELYSYHDGTVVNVTTADDGKITMELGKPDAVDRLPTAGETDTLCMEMEAFCRDFAEIEERLLAYGVVVADRITLLPPTAEYAQIINTEDYEATTDETESGSADARRALQRRLVSRRQKFRSVSPEQDVKRKKGQNV